MGYIWDANKAETNFRKHRVRMQEVLAVFDDPHGITIIDNESDPDEQRFLTLGIGSLENILVVVYTYREEDIRIISARRATPKERKQYEEQLL